MLSISLCVTIKNESGSFSDFWKSIQSQSKLPDEMVIVDGGSTDDTVTVVENLIKKSKFPVLLIKEGDSNRSQGRNLAIKNASKEIIALTDSGCRLDKNWLKEITLPFKNSSVEVVPGNYKIENSGLSDVATVAAHLTVNSLESGIEKPGYLASSRSLALLRRVWEKSGGYPEELNTAEDLVFANNLRTMSFVHQEAPQALVYWRPPKSLWKVSWTFFHYAYGDGLAFAKSPHAMRYGVKLFIIGMILLLTAVYPASLALGGVLLACWWVSQSHRLKGKHKALAKVPGWKILMVVVVLFWVTLAGFLWGLGYLVRNVRK